MTITDPNWLLYGAYGYTGKLIAEEAIRRGHRPVLAGRSEKKLVPLAERLGLDYIVLDLSDQGRLTQIVSGFDLVLHAAGPFVYTAGPMVQACLAGKAHYLDITGEVVIFEQLLALDQAARRQGVALIPGVGFDVVPTNCLATYVANQLSRPTELKLGVYTLAGVSAGTTKTMLEHVSGGILVRRDGHLSQRPIGQGAQTIRFADRERTVIPITWGDLTSVYQSTGIPNITAYLAYPDMMVTLLRWVGPTGMRLLSLRSLRRLAQKLVEWTIHGPGEETRRTARCQIWAWATNEAGEEAQAWLETPEAYHYTALAGVRCVEQTLVTNPSGSLAPAQAFGPDFILGIPGTIRYDRLNFKSKHPE